MLMNATRWLMLAGTLMATDTPSRALATPLPNFAFTALTMAVVVVKSWFMTFITRVSLLSKAVSTMRSTSAPPGMRPEVVTPVETLEPAAAASTAAIVSEPCATA